MKLVFKKLQLKIVQNERATYSFAELKEFIDWEVKRVYFIQDCKENTGQHCHKQEKEMFVMQKGSCVAVIDQGNGKEEIPLEGPGDAIYVGDYVWHGFKDFSLDAVLLALSSTNYSPDRSDYVEDYEEYKKLVHSQ
ncbi:MAG: WblP protein [Candidatus Magasanikbacteria bacterium GW2011_GWA2_37_8]|uniref:WblP protein n=1 Tax=Candidatus Magasanikbacteria bacterium GW2011_GWA2_37_8 TaxID=1619036 RepID=A0A0G0HPJ0_9BACT|nr:MAG: WblP protein [Candidatus Magasanikbacteria bacterium GW2011_GWA2_37_8]